MEKIQLQINSSKVNKEQEKNFVEYSIGIKTVRFDELNTTSSNNSVEKIGIEKVYNSNNHDNDSSSVEKKDYNEEYDMDEKNESDLTDETDWEWFDPFDENIYFILTTARP